MAGNLSKTNLSALSFILPRTLCLFCPLFVPWLILSSQWSQCAAWNMLLLQDWGQNLGFGAPISLTDFFKNILVGDHYWLHWKSGYTAIWAILAQHRGTFLHGHKDLRNHWEGMRMQLLPVCIISLSWYSAWIVAVENSFLLILLQRCS